MQQANYVIMLLVCATLTACSADEQAVDAKTAAEDRPTSGQDRSTAAPAERTSPGETGGSLDESAAAYIARRDPGEEIRAGEVAPEAVGAIASCAVCHGPDGGGNESLGAPRIGGLAEWYLARQLKYFKAGLRGATDADPHGIQMRAMALPLTDAAIEDLAAYLANLQPPAAPALTEGDAKRGAQLYQVCTACHGQDARGNPQLNTPSLVQQSGSYLVRQLEHFRNGLRGADPADKYGQQMLPIVKSTLNDRQDAVDVVSHIASLREGERGASAP